MKVVKKPNAGFGIYVDLKDADSGRFLARALLSDHADFIATACNSYDLMVKALQYTKMRLELADEDRFDKTTLQQISDALKAAGAA